MWTFIFFPTFLFILCILSTKVVIQFVHENAGTRRLNFTPHQENQRYGAGTGFRDSLEPSQVG
jgi:hypothetical protein